MYSILMWEPPDGLSIGQALESFLQKRLDILGGRGQGAWSVDCDTLQSVPNLAGEPKVSKWTSNKCSYLRESRRAKDGLCNSQQ